MKVHNQRNAEFKKKAAESNPDSVADFNEKLTEGLPAQVIDFAKRLKAAYGNKYKDEFYINYAKSNFAQQLAGSYCMTPLDLDNQILFKYPEWVEYSYEEIIAMHEGGVSIPREVVSWAYSKQDSDITSYVVIAENVQAEDNYFGEGSSIGGTEKLEATVQGYASKSEASIEKAETVQDKITENINNVTILNSNSEQQRKNIKEFNNISDELKFLEEKNKKGNLTLSEKMRYNSLVKEYNTMSSELKSMMKETEEVNRYLSELDDMTSELDGYNELAQNTQEAADSLSGSIYNSSLKSSGISYNNIPNSSSILMGVRGQSLAENAIDVSNDLVQTAFVNVIKPDVQAIQPELNNVEEYKQEISISDNNDEEEIPPVQANEVQDVLNSEGETIQTEPENTAVQDELPEPEAQDNSEEKSPTEQVQDAVKAMLLSSAAAYPTPQNAYMLSTMTLTAMGLLLTGQAENQKVSQDVEQKTNMASSEAQEVSQEAQKSSQDSMRQEQLAQKTSVEAGSRIEMLQADQEAIVQNVQTPEQQDDIQIQTEQNINEQQAVASQTQTVIDASNNKIEQNTKNVETRGTKIFNKITENLDLAKNFRESNDSLSELNQDSGLLSLSTLTSGIFNIEASEVQNIEIPEDNEMVENAEKPEKNEKDEKNDSENNSVQNTKPQPQKIDESKKENDLIPNEADDVESQELPPVREDINLDESIIAFAGTSNINLSELTSNSDKEDRKLSRFNNDSIIESRRKRRRVTAVSATSTGKSK